MAELNCIKVCLCIVWIVSLVLVSRLLHLTLGLVPFLLVGTIIERRLSNLPLVKGYRARLGLFVVGSDAQLCSFLDLGERQALFLIDKVLAGSFIFE